MKKILVVAGTRPEIIKLAPVILEARSGNKPKADIVFCLTGQHLSMAEEATEIFSLQPDISLHIMRPNQTLNQIAQSVFEHLPRVIDRTKPDVLMVQGDTTSAAMAALCGFNQKVPIAHVEAGLRSFTFDAPYPEECNRRVINVFAQYNFCPTPAARQNLLREGVLDERIHLTGNTIVDAIRIIRELHPLSEPARAHPAVRSPYILVTAHRRESFGQGLKNLCEAIRTCALEFPGHQFVYPVHLNPNVQGPVHALLGNLPNILLTNPVPYLSLLTLLSNCEFVLTDSGGIQEEAPSLGKYCIVLRDVTERMESVQLGISELVGTDRARIIKAVRHQIHQPVTVQVRENPYGDGHAAARILSILQ